MDPIEEIKSRISIEDVVGRVVDLKRSGSTLKGLCPFHTEKTPSFYVTPARGTYHCFGCGRGGDVLSFVMELERLTFPEALRRLGDQAGIEIPERERQGASLKNQILEANEAATDFYRQALGAPPGERARSYLRSRAFDEHAEALFALGCAPDARDGLVRHLRARGVSDAVMLAAGLARQDENTKLLRDYFRGRLMFPIRDAGGKTIGFGARTLADQQPKYLNSPQTDVFDKSGVLFGIHLAADTVRTQKRVVVVEGYLDAIRAQTAGFGGTVATLGTAVTAKHLTALARFAPTVVLALDPDPAGQAAAARTALAALAEVTARRGREAGAQATLDLRIARLPADGGDPDELIRDRPEAWQSAVDAAIPAFEFFFEQTLASLDRSSDAWRQEAIDRLLPVIRQFSTSTGWQAVWMQRLSRETGLDPRLLQQALPTGRPSARSRPQRGSGREAGAQAAVSGLTTEALAADPVAVQEESLLALLVALVVIPERSVPEVEIVPWQRPQHTALATALLDWRHTGSYDLDAFIDTLPPEVQVLTRELRQRDVPLPPEEQTEVAVAYQARQLEHRRLQSQLRQAEMTLRETEPADQGDITRMSMRVMSRLREVDSELNELSRQVIRAGGTA